MAERSTKLVSPGGVTQNYTSFSGSDITVTFYVPPEKTFGLNLLSVQDVLGRLPSSLFEGRISEAGGFLVVGNLQTISISSSRTVSPVRRLGESHVQIYTSGPRTIAGTMVFSMLYRNSFVEIFRRSRFENLNEPFFVDMLPEMTIIIQAANELGHTGRQVISGVKIVNTGTTFSVDDLYTEETYSYVATHATPFIPDPERSIIKESFEKGPLKRSGSPPDTKPRTVSELGLSEFSNQSNPK